MVAPPKLDCTIEMGKSLRSFGALQFSPDGKVFGINHSKETIAGWDLATKKRIFWLEHPGMDLTNFALTPDGQTVVTISAMRRVEPLKRTDGDNPGTLRFWRVCDGIPLDKTLISLDFGGNFAIGNPIAWSADRKTIFVRGLGPTGWKGNVTVWDAETGKLRRRIEQKSWSNQALAIAPDNKEIAWAGNNTIERVRLADSERPRLEHVPRAEAIANMNTPVFGGVTYSPDGKYLVASVDLPWTRAAPFPIDDAPPLPGMEISGVRKPSYRESQLWVWDTSTGKRAAVLKSDHYIRSIYFQPKGRYLACPSMLASESHYETLIDFWDIEERKCVLSWRVPHPPFVFAPMPDDRRFATIHDRGSIRIWTWPQMPKR